MKKQKKNPREIKHKHKWQLAQITTEPNFDLSMCGIYQQKAYIICPDCGEMKFQWIGGVIRTLSK